MPLTRSALAMLMLLSVVAFGGSVSPLQRAVEASPYTYYHFEGSVWWGEPVTFQTRVMHASPELADIEILARAAGKTVGRERLFFANHDGRWQARVPLIDPDYGAILGPTATRRPSVQERSRIEAAFGRFKGERGCVQLTIGVSRLDGRYASASTEPAGDPQAPCAGTGALLFTRAGSEAWRYLGDASAPFSCTSAPAGVIRSLFGECLIRAPLR